MSAHRLKGMTLIEVLIAVAITSVVMALAVSVVGSGVKLARKGEQTVSSNEAARGGMEMLLRDLRAVGVPQGIYVTEPGGTPILINAIFTQPGTGTADTGIDDLWMVVPRPNAMQHNCLSPGSGAVVEAKGTGSPLAVSCVTPFAATDTLMVSNYTTAALISGLTFGANTITSAQAGTPNFSSAPQKGGFQKGDLVFPVDIVRYSVKLNPMLATDAFPLGRPELIREIGGLNTAPYGTGPVSAAQPFTVAAGSPSQRFPDVVDLQVAFGSGTAPALSFGSAHNTLFNSATAPLAVRISVVGITPRPILDDNQKIQPFGPVTVEDHVPTPATLDGYRRSVYRRRVDLLNSGAVNL